MDYLVVKRVIDIFCSVVLLLIFSPIIILTSFLIKLTSKGPIFADTPKRVGKDGRPFYAYKFRSMVVNAHNLLRTDPNFKSFYDKYKKSDYKLFDDPRLTPVGKVIRKYSIDEIPQLVNVLKGEMHIVGPRPYYKDELKQQLKKYPREKVLLKDVLSVKPGITGLWQVSGRSTLSFNKRIKMDAQYARTRSILLDIQILLKTPWVMISGQNTV